MLQALRCANVESSVYITKEVTNVREEDAKHRGD
jgi:hypothetical protein